MTTASAHTDVGLTAARAFDVLSADSNYCENVKHPGTLANMTIHAFKLAWNTANPGKPLPIGTSNYEITVAAALSSVLRTEVPSGCNPMPIELPDTQDEFFTRHERVSKLYENKSDPHRLTGPYGAYGVGDATQGDALFTAAQTLLTALSNSTGFPTTISCSDTNVATAAGAFQSAYNAAPAVPNTTVASTGVYDAATQVALQSTINTYQALTPPVSFTSGSAAPACSAGAGGGKHHKKPAPPVASVPDPPPVIEFPDTASPPVATDTTSPPPDPPAVQAPAPPPDPPAVQAPAPPPPAPIVVQPPAPPAIQPPAPPVEYDPQPYIVQPGDSTEIISRRLGVPVHELLRANPHKPHVQVRAGVHTWRTLTHGERLRVPARKGRASAHQRRGRLGAVEFSGLMSLATVATAALHADPKHCESVRHPGSRVNVAVHNFKKAWNAANPQKKVPVGTGRYEQSVADALNMITSGMAPASCSGGEKEMEHRRPAPPVAMYHRPAPPRAYQPAPPYGHRPEVPRGRFPRQLRPFGYMPQPGMPVDDAWGDDDAIDMPMPPPAVATPPDPPPMAPASAPGPGPAAPPDSPSVDSSAPPADPSAPPDDSGKHKHGKKGGEKPPPGNEEGLSTGAKVGIGVGIAAVLGGIAVAVVKSKKKPSGAKERRR